jgi:hypothetical protein
MWFRDFFERDEMIPKRLAEAPMDGASQLSLAACFIDRGSAHA